MNRYNKLILLVFLFYFSDFGFLELAFGHDHEHEEEEKTVFSPLMLQESGVEISTAGPGKISSELKVYGRLMPNQDKLFHVNPRFEGIIKEAPVGLGSQVKTGQVLAVLESDQSLQRYEIKSTIDGTVIEKHATVGEHVAAGTQILAVADFSDVWGDFQIYGEDAEKISQGQEVIITLPTMEEPVVGKVNFISTTVDEATQSKLIRTVLPNPEGKLRPGLFVTGILRTEGQDIPLVVTREAIQTLDNSPVVFLSNGHTLSPAKVELGRQDSKYVEVISGVSVGAKYVSKNSYIVKADLLKSEASHDH